MAEERDVRFVTEESFDFGLLSPSDSQEEEEDEGEAGARAGGGSGRWSPLHGARLEEMVREATRLAAQLEQCHLSPSARHGPRSPRRETFVVKDSPVRALLPTVEPRGPPPATTRPPRQAPGCPPLPPPSPAPGRCHPAVTPQRCPRDPPGPGCPPPTGWAPLGLALPRGRGLQPGASQSPSRWGQQGTGSARGWGQHGHLRRGAPAPWGPAPHQGPSTLGQVGAKATPKPHRGGVGGSGCPRRAPMCPSLPRPAKGEGGALPPAPPPPASPAPGPPTVPVPSSRPPCPQRHPQGTWTDPGWGGCTGWEGTRGQRCGGGTGSPPGHWLGVQTRTCPQPPPPPRKTAMSSTPR
ncbi:proline/serine-rich coiled-coil protein 1 [Falco biarmicus]|uniref:proline/serine-rich coiled-coil protein 1 n=1 Tax=Falco biarmicus TaxID=345155 RepID=UPI0024BC4ADD|nr:proline/serine-rich coiled-coil protein 1 [Falco biarmicus]